MKYTLENITVEDFFFKLKTFEQKIQSFTSATKIEKEELTTFSVNIKKKVKNYITKYVKPAPNILLDSLEWGIFRDRPFFYYPDPDRKYTKEVAEAIDRLEEYNKNLNFTINYLSIIDSIINPEYSASIESIIEKNDYVLKKLNAVFGDPFYSVSKIFRLNNIKFREGEPREICEDLKRRGYVILKDEYGQKDDVKISVKGAAYVERKNKKKLKEKKADNLEEKLNHIIEHLINLGYGQEIIFNEIEELRGLQYKLSKKSWSQLLKGKLLDLALDKVLSKETAGFVYEYLTNNDFKLLH